MNDNVLNLESHIALEIGGKVGRLKVVEICPCVDECNLYIGIRFGRMLVAYKEVLRVRCLGIWTRLKLMTFAFKAKTV